MATGQVIGRHEVFEYTYKLGPAEERKRIKLVVIQRRDQRRKSLIAAQKYLEHAPVRLRVNLHRAQYGDPEVTTGSHHVPITLRRKIKAAPARTTTRVVRAPARPPQAAAAHGLLTPPPTAPPPPEPARIELVDPPVPRHDSPGILIADPDPIVVVPGSPSDSGHDTPPIHPPVVPPSPSGSSVSLNRPKVKRSGSFGSSFRRFPSLMGLIRRNSKNTAPPSVADTQHTPGYFDHDPRRSEEHEQTIVEERDSELGSPIGAPSGYGPPSVVSGGISRKPVPPLPESPVSTRSRSLSLRRRPSVSGSPRNRLVKASPRNVPLPDSVRDPSVRDPSVVGSPLVTGAFPHSVTAGSYDGRSTHSRRTNGSVHQTPEYVHDEYLHDSPTVASRSLHSPSMTQHSMRDGSVVNGHAGLIMAPESARSGFTNGHAHSREPSITQLTMMDGSVIHDRSIHGDRSVHGGSVHERSIHNGSDHRSSGGRSLRHHELPSDGYRSPSIPDMPVRDIAFSDGDRENEHGAWSPRSGSASPSLQPPSHRGASPSLHVPSQRGSPSLHAPSHRGTSPSLHGPSRGASPSLHDPHSRVASPFDRRETSPSIQGRSHREHSPSTHAPSYNGNGHEIVYSPPMSMQAPSVKSRGASSVASSKVPMSTISRQFHSRPKSPLSASGSSHASSRKSNRPPGPEITPVPMSEGPRSTAPSMHAASIASHRTGASRSVGKSPLARTDEVPRVPSKPPTVAGSTVSEAAYRIALPESTVAPSEMGTSVFGTSVYGSAIQHPSRAPSEAILSRAPSAAAISRAPSAAAVSRAPSAALVSRAPSAAAISRSSSAAVVSRIPSVSPEHISRAPSAAGIFRAPSTAGTARAPSVAGTARGPPSVAGTARGPPSVAGTSRGPPSVAGTARGPPSVAETSRGPPSVAGTARAPSRAGTTRAPSRAGTTRAPSEGGITRAPSAAGISHSGSVSGIPRAPSAAGIHRSASAAGTHRAPSAAGIHRSPSVAGTAITRAPSAAGVPLPPSVAGSQRIPPSIIGSRYVPSSIAGSTPSIAPSVALSRHTPPPEPGFAAAPSDIALESESHSGVALRAQARLEGDKMRMAFEASQAAYREGDGERAKELAELGRAHQTRMQELHAEAAEQIFREKNEGREPGEIDLHGLTVKEARSRVSQFIREAPSLGQTNLRIITGKGLHSEGDAQIIPAVEEYLTKKGLRHHTDETNGGVIVVELGPRSPVSD